jgi:hypothetical protein
MNDDGLSVEITGYWYIPGMVTPSVYPDKQGAIF